STARARMAMRAIALGRIVEERQAARLLRRQRGLAREVGIVFAAVGIEGGVILLIGLERFEDEIEGATAVIEDRSAPEAAQRIGIGRAANSGDDRRGARIRHFVGRKQRQPSLIAAAIDAPIPGQPTRWPVIDTGIALIV